MRFERDERIAGIVANWPKGALGRARRAARPASRDDDFADIVRQYIDDHPGAVSAQAKAAAESYRRSRAR